MVETFPVNRQWIPSPEEVVRYQAEQYKPYVEKLLVTISEGLQNFFFGTKCKIEVTGHPYQVVQMAMWFYISEGWQVAYHREKVIVDQTTKKVELREYLWFKDKNAPS